MRSSYKPFLLVAAILCLTTTVVADWPQWRGPNRDGKVKDAAIPATWPKALKEEWKTTVGIESQEALLACGSVRGKAQMLQRLFDAGVVWGQQQLWRDDITPQLDVSPRPCQCLATE